MGDRGKLARKLPNMYAMLGSFLESLSNTLDSV
jgi:hypothetical protein